MTEATAFPCKTCRWCHAGLLAWIFGDYSNAECRNPVVVDNWHLNARQGWVQCATLPEPITPADPVTGTPERRRIPASMARGQQFAIRRASTEPIPSPFTPCPDDRRAKANCGPDGRYWTATPGRAR